MDCSDTQVAIKVLGFQKIKNIKFLKVRYV